MESLKSMWATVKAKLKALGMEFSAEYNPEMVFLDTLVERVHALEIQLGIVHVDPVQVDHVAVAQVLATAETAAAPGGADPAAVLADLTKKDELAPGAADTAAAPAVIDSESAGDGSHKPGEINPALVFDANKIGEVIAHDGSTRVGYK